MKLPVIYKDVPIDEKHIVREEYVKLQKGLCYYCHKPLGWPCVGEIAKKKIKPHLYPPGFFTHPVHLHHDHNTGLTLGAVHNHCNAVLWEYHGE